MEPSALRPYTENKVYHIRGAAESRCMLALAFFANIVGLAIGLVRFALSEEYQWNAFTGLWFFSMFCFLIICPFSAGHIAYRLERNKEGFVFVRYNGCRTLINMDNIAQIKTAEKKTRGKVVVGQCYILFVLKNPIGCGGKNHGCNLEETQTFLEDTGLQAPANSQIATAPV